MKLFNKNRRRGNALVEFAIGVSVLVTIFGGTFRFGYTFFRYNTLLAAVNGGARMAAYLPYDSYTSTPSDQYKTKVKNMVVYGNVEGTGNPVAPGLATSNVGITV